MQGRAAMMKNTIEISARKTTKGVTGSAIIFS
jgi:hypothetical protein